MVDGVDGPLEMETIQRPPLARDSTNGFNSGGGGHCGVLGGRPRQSMPNV